MPARNLDDGKSLFDFMPSRVDGAQTSDPAERPTGEPGDPALKAAVLEAVKTVRDPELPVNLVDLGLIYELEVDVHGAVYIAMTLTAPSCPVAGELPGQVAAAARTVPGITSAKVDLVWTPPWTKDLMTEEAKLELGLF
ncbi:MAG TPA: iron-sulfur cluster assembly protein [Stellaceae bacterium]|nr:iron-sulfur cluster assembly protein [Stellaceae bacterium]